MDGGCNESSMGMNNTRLDMRMGSNPSPSMGVNMGMGFGATTMDMAMSSTLGMHVNMNAHMEMDMSMGATGMNLDVSSQHVTDMGLSNVTSALEDGASMGSGQLNGASLATASAASTTVGLSKGSLMSNSTARQPLQLRSPSQHNSQLGMLSANPQSRMGKGLGLGSAPLSAVHSNANSPTRPVKSAAPFMNQGSAHQHQQQKQVESMDSNGSRQFQLQSPARTQAPMVHSQNQQQSSQSQAHSQMLFQSQSQPTPQPQTQPPHSARYSTPLRRMGMLQKHAEENPPAAASGSSGLLGSPNWERPSGLLKPTIKRMATVSLGASTNTSTLSDETAINDSLISCTSMATSTTLAPPNTVSAAAQANDAGEIVPALEVASSTASVDSGAVAPDSDASVMKAANAVVAAATVVGLVSPRSSYFNQLRTPRHRSGSTVCVTSPRGVQAPMGSPSVVGSTAAAGDCAAPPDTNSMEYRRISHPQHQSQLETMSVLSEASSGMTTSGALSTTTTATATAIAPLSAPIPSPAMQARNLTLAMSTSGPHSNAGSASSEEGGDSGNAGGAMQMGNLASPSADSTIAPTPPVLSTAVSTSSAGSPAPQIVLYNNADRDTRQRMEVGYRSAVHGARAAAKAAQECVEIINDKEFMTTTLFTMDQWPIEIDARFLETRQLSESTRELSTTSASPTPTINFLRRVQTNSSQLSTNEDHFPQQQPQRIIGAKYYPDGAVYEGELDPVTLKRSGSGTFLNRHGDAYEGEWKEDRRSGCGIYSWRAGGCYRGEWKSGKMDGLGAFSWPNGDEYWGEWKAGRMFGKGKKRISNGDVHFGLWSEDAANGFGRRFFACGDRHEGLYRNDKRHGYGVYLWASGERYEGDWVEGTMTGKGKKYILGGDIYEGDWVRDLAHGMGVKTFACGDRHEGQYRLDQRHGYGVYSWTNGDRFEGFWIDGEQCKRGTYWYANGNVFTGYYVRGRKHGRGLFTTGDTTYEEYWENHQRKSRVLTRYWPRRLLHTTPAHITCTPDSNFGPVRDMPPLPPNCYDQLLTLDAVERDIANLSGSAQHVRDNQVSDATPTPSTSEMAPEGAMSSTAPSHSARDENSVRNQPMFYISPNTVRHVEPNDSTGSHSAVGTTTAGPAHHAHGQSQSSEAASAMSTMPADVSENTTGATGACDSRSAANDDKNKLNGICTVCYVANINCVLIRCGHMATCLECSDRLDRCPICRANIEDAIQIYRV